VWWLLWVVLAGVVAAALLIAYLVDRRTGAAGQGMTDRDRRAADGVVRGHQTRADSYPGTTGAHLGAGIGDFSAGG
jgi:hypothetical protein